MRTEVNRNIAAEMCFTLSNFVLSENVKFGLIYSTHLHMLSPDQKNQASGQKPIIFKNHVMGKLEIFIPWNTYLNLDQSKKRVRCSLKCEIRFPMYWPVGPLCGDKNKKKQQNTNILSWLCWSWNKLDLVQKWNKNDGTEIWNEALSKSLPVAETKPTF